MMPGTIANMKQVKPRGNPNWKKNGPSPNPDGRKRMDPEVKAAFKEMTPKALKRLDELLMSTDEHVALKAIHEVLDRELGKPTQPVEFDPTRIPDPELRRAAVEIVESWKQEGVVMQ